MDETDFGKNIRAKRVIYVQGQSLLGQNKLRNKFISPLFFVSVHLTTLSHHFFQSKICSPIPSGYC